MTPAGTDALAAELIGQEAIDLATHGGARPGAGRKPKKVKRKQRKYSLTDAEDELIAPIVDRLREHTDKGATPKRIGITFEY